MVEVKNLRMSYGKYEVLKDVSFQIEKGRIVGLLGANGAGKSTIMNIMTGYLKPVAGEILICGEDIRRHPKTAKKHIGYLPEVPPLYKDMKVLEYLLYAAELKGISDRGEEVLRVMELLHLKDRQYDQIKKLSKGLQQRVGLAQALLGNPEVLVLDEPLSGLDPEESKQTRELLKSLRDEHVIIISSHILSEIEELCNRIMMLKDGELVLESSTQKAKERGKRNLYRFTIKGEKTQLDTWLLEYAQVAEVHYQREKEPGVHEWIVVASNNRDIRDNILGYLSSKRVVVYGVEKVENSLEDLFIEMNKKEEE